MGVAALLFSELGTAGEPTVTSGAATRAAASCEDDVATAGSLVVAVDEDEVGGGVAKLGKLCGSVALCRRVDVDLLMEGEVAPVEAGPPLEVALLFAEVD